MKPSTSDSELTNRVSTIPTPKKFISLTVKLVEPVLDIKINYYAKIDFVAFEKFIDELGGKCKSLSAMSGDDEPRMDFIVLVGGLNVQFIEKSRTVLREGDVVSLLPPAGGG